VGTSFTQWHEILARNTTDTKLSYGENPQSISPGIGTVPGHDRHQDRITVANTRYASSRA